jgi:prepilin-type N-terminal cleavage/methylation domain-containing protein
MKDLVKRARERAHPVEIEGEEAAEAGFTLIELMVVLLIIAILLAIAIPTFLGVTNTAGDRAAQSNLTNALTEGKALYEVNDAYTGSNAAYTAGTFTSQAPEFTWNLNTACSSTSGNCISFAVFDISTVGDSQGLSLASYSSKTNTCWYAFDLEAAPPATGSQLTDDFPSAGVWYAKGTVGTTPTDCKAINPDTDTTLGATTLVAGTTGTNYGNAPLIKPNN